MHSDKGYDFVEARTAEQVLEQAAEIIKSKYLRGNVFTSSQATSDYLRYKMGGNDREVFAVLLLDSQHRLIEFKEVFFGTINSASVYPREIIKLALNHNAAAVIFAHNHPSGDPEPSNADKRITQKLKSALELVDIPVLDHFVIGETCVSFAEKGFI